MVCWTENHGNGCYVPRVNEPHNPAEGDAWEESDILWGIDLQQTPRGDSSGGGRLAVADSMTAMITHRSTRRPNVGNDRKRVFVRLFRRLGLVRRGSDVARRLGSGDRLTLFSRLRFFKTVATWDVNYSSMRRYNLCFAVLFALVTHAFYPRSA
uniref:Transmembrane protein n=1 Tax=Steinernema glaseri TaxID=37863 RepID=A0A1I7Y824_9BILA